MKATNHYETQQLIALGNIRERIEMAKVRCLPLGELVHQVEADPLLDYPAKAIYLYRLTEIELDDQSANRIVVLVDRILAASARASQLEKRRAESMLRPLIRALPVQAARPIAFRLLSEKRKSRRLIGSRHLQRIRRQAQINHRERPPFTPAEATAIMRQFERTNDTELLELVIFHPEAVFSAELGAELLRVTNESYLRMRIFEALLVNQVPGTIEASAEDPEHFIRAAARLGRKDLIPHIKELLKALPEDYRAIGEVVSALGKLGAHDEVARLEAQIEPALRKFERRFLA